MNSVIVKRSIAGYGWTPDFPDKRDFKFRVEKPVSLPDNVDLRLGMPPVYDQGDLGSCTANAIAAVFDFERKKQGEAFIGPSRLFIYYNERDIEGSISDDAGAQIRDGISSVVKQGVCAEREWPYDTSQFATKPSQSCYTDAVLNEALQYRRITASLSDMLQCLASGFPFVFGFTVYESFESDEVAKTGIVPMPVADEWVMGGHAVVAVGYDLPNKRFLVRNSWNTDWGIRGHFWMPFEYLSDPNLADDRWCISQVSIKAPLPGPTPTPTPEPEPIPAPPEPIPAPVPAIIDHGIPNFVAVDAAINTWRGGQPLDASSWDYLKSLGITQVVKLNTDSEGSDDYASGIGIQVLKCPITLTQEILTEPDLDSLSTAVAFAASPNIFVHCGSDSRTRHAVLINDGHDAGGNDRTGVCIGLHRIRSGWTKERARAEMAYYGFHPILFGLGKAFEDLS